MARIIHVPLFFGIGCTMSTAGVSPTDWQLYVVIGLAALACAVSEVFK